MEVEPESIQLLVDGVLEEIQETLPGLVSACDDKSQCRLAIQKMEDAVKRYVEVADQAVRLHAGTSDKRTAKVLAGEISRVVDAVDGYYEWIDKLGGTRQVSEFEPQLMALLEQVNKVQEEIERFTHSNKGLGWKQFNNTYAKYRHITDKLRKVTQMMGDKPGIGPMLVEGLRHLEEALVRFVEWSDSLPAKRSGKRKRTTRKRKTLKKKRARK
jgi:hypothetical protein